MTSVPDNPKIYHIVHVDRLASIVADGALMCDAKIAERKALGSVIGMSHIKRRRLKELRLNSYSDLHVGDCVPFYFCPRSIMLYLLYRGNHPDLNYHDGQNAIIHLEADLFQSVEWAEHNQLRWVFTNANAGSRYCSDYNKLSDLNKLNWKHIAATDWRDHQVKEDKQSEFLLQREFAWSLVKKIGVRSAEMQEIVQQKLSGQGPEPRVQVKAEWYY